MKKKNIVLIVLTLVLLTFILAGCDSGSVEQMVTLNIGIEGNGIVKVDGDELVVGEELTYKKGTDVDLKQFQQKIMTLPAGLLEMKL